MDTGIELIEQERQKQFIKGRTVANDVANNSSNELLSAIMLLAANIGFRRNNILMPNDAFEDLRPESWDRERCLKYVNRTEVEQLKMIGAFAAAEIDRIGEL